MSVVILRTEHQGECEIVMQVSRCSSGSWIMMHLAVTVLVSLCTQLDPLINQ